jgi:Sulfotransferase family
VPSICSLFATFHSLNAHASAIDMRLLAAGMCARMAHNMEHVTQLRGAHPARKVIDVHYRTLLADPIAEAERVYDEVGLTLSATARDRMLKFLKVNRHGQGPKHNYTLADFGLDESIIEKHLGAYIDKYAVARERG